MEFKELMSAFATETGMTELAPDADGAYVFLVDDLTLMLAPIENGARLALYAELDEPPAEGRELVYRAMLEASFPRGGVARASFSIDGESGRICLHGTESLAAMDYAEFKKVLENYVNAADDWRQKLASFPSVFTEVHDAVNHAENEARSFAVNGFMRVRGSKRVGAD